MEQIVKEVTEVVAPSAASIAIDATKNATSELSALELALVGGGVAIVLF